MNLEEFRNQLSSEATEENKKLKRELIQTKQEMQRLKSKYETRIRVLEQYCNAFTNRCYVLTQGMLCKCCAITRRYCSHAKEEWEGKCER